MMKIILQTSTALWLSLALLSSTVSAKGLAHIEGVINQVQPQGTGRLNFWGFHVYDATLYRPAGKDSAEFALDIKYQKSFSGLLQSNKNVSKLITKPPTNLEIYRCIIGDSISTVSNPTFKNLVIGLRLNSSSV